MTCILSQFGYFFGGFGYPWLPHQCIMSQVDDLAGSYRRKKCSTWNILYLDGDWAKCGPSGDVRRDHRIGNAGGERAPNSIYPLDKCWEAVRTTSVGSLPEKITVLIPESERCRRRNTLFSKPDREIITLDWTISGST